MAVWDICITAGQSQMSGQPNQGAGSAPGCSALVRDWNGSAFVQLDDPNSPMVAKRPSAGSCLPRFGDAYTSVTGRQLGVIRGAEGGTALIHSNSQAGKDDWSPSGTLRSLLVTEVNQAMAAITGGGDTIGRVFIIWSQGFRDAAGGNDLTTYADAQDALLAYWQANISSGASPSIRMYIEEMYTPPPQAALDAQCQLVKAQQHISIDRNPDMKIGFDQGLSYHDDDHVGFISPYDIFQLHYSQVGLNNMGVQYAAHVLEDQGLSEPEVPPDENLSTTSQLAHRLRVTCPPLPPLPREFNTGTMIPWVAPFTGTITLTGWGGGAGAKGGVPLGAGGGGGGGGEKRVHTISVIQGLTYFISIGDGGAGVAYNTAGNAGNGGDTIFYDTDGTTVLFRCKGGIGPVTGTNARLGGAGGTGGTGGTGTNGVNGSDAAAGSGTNGGNGGAGGDSGGAGGAGGTASPNHVGGNGTAPGGGAGGGKGNQGGANGGNGAAGKLTIS